MPQQGLDVLLYVVVARAFPEGLGTRMVVPERAIDELPQGFRIKFHVQQGSGLDPGLSRRRIARADFPMKIRQGFRASKRQRSPGIIAPPVPPMQRSVIVIILVAPLLRVTVAPVIVRFPPWRLQVPAAAALLPVSGDMAVTRPRPLPHARIPDMAMAVRGPVARRPDMARHGDRDVLDERRRRRTDVDPDRHVTDPEADVRAIGEGWCRKQRDHHGGKGRNVLGSSHVILLVNRAHE